MSNTDNLSNCFKQTFIKSEEHMLETINEIINQIGSFDRDNRYYLIELFNYLKLLICWDQYSLTQLKGRSMVYKGEITYMEFINNRNSNRNKKSDKKWWQSWKQLFK